MPDGLSWSSLGQMPVIGSLLVLVALFLSFLWRFYRATLEHQTREGQANRESFERVAQANRDSAERVAQEHTEQMRITQGEVNRNTQILVLHHASTLSPEQRQRLDEVTLLLERRSPEVIEPITKDKN
jgi:uncharacterized membrane protein